MELIKQITEIIENESGNIAYGYSNEKIEDFRKCILKPLSEKIHQLILSHYSQAEEVLSEDEMRNAWPYELELKRYEQNLDPELVSEYKEKLQDCLSIAYKAIAQAQNAHDRLKCEA